jgi:hypothetical protein
MDIRFGKLLGMSGVYLLNRQWKAWTGLIWLGRGLTISGEYYEHDNAQ